MTEKEGDMPYKYRHDGRNKDFNEVRGDAAREMTAIRKDDADVAEKATRKMPTVASPILEQSCKETASGLWIILEFNTRIED